MATGDSLQAGRWRWTMGLWSRGVHVHPATRSRDSMIPVKRAAATSRRRAQARHRSGLYPSAQLARESQRPHDADLAPSAPPRTRSGLGSGQRRRRCEETIFSQSASTIPPFPGRGSESWRGDAPAPDGQVLRESGEDPHPSIRDSTAGVRRLWCGVEPKLEAALPGRR
jgi:hypothetical protein